MPLILRIDDRLIHGQVLVGWGCYYNIKHIIVGNNDIAKNDWEKEMLLVAAGDIDAQVLSLDDTLTFINDHLNDDDNTMVLLETAYDINALANMGLQLKKINIGGIHYTEGRREYLTYLFLDETDEKIFRKLLSEGYKFICQDVPTGNKYDLAKLIEKYND